MFTTSLGCALTIAPDGSEDDQIHVFKPHGPIPEGRAMLFDARQAGRVVQTLDGPEDPDEDTASVLTEGGPAVEELSEEDSSEGWVSGDDEDG